MMYQPLLLSQLLRNSSFERIFEGNILKLISRSLSVVLEAGCMLNRLLTNFRVMMARSLVTKYNNPTQEN